MAWCLPTYLADNFLGKLQKGEIDWQNLAKMSSSDRKTYFTEMFGQENAGQVNRLFESKLLLKNQQRGMVTWAKTIAGLKPKAQRDMVARINRLEKALNPETEQAFLEDLVSYKIGSNITMNEASTLSELARTATQKKEAMLNGGNRMEYGYARVAFDNYLGELKSFDNRSLGQIAKDYSKSPGKLVSDAAGLSKSAKATLDASWIGRQGWKLIFSHPGQWMKTVRNTFSDIGRTFGGKKVMDEVRADIYSRPNFENYVKDKLAVDVVEEQFPESQLLKKIPGVGKVHEAAETAFTAAAYRNRVDLYDLYYDMAKKSGIEDPTGQGIGKLVNSLTSRASLGKLEPSANVINNVFFSGRKIKSDWDFLTAHTFSQNISPFVRKQAAINLVKTIMGTAGVLALAQSTGTGKVELDPRSSDFGQIRVGNTRYDVTGGMKSISVLGARLAYGLLGKPAVKSAQTGKVYDINTGKYGSTDGTDLVFDFFQNKLSPVASVVRDYLRDQTFAGEKPTASTTIRDLTVPLPITTSIELQDADSANYVLSMILEELGISTNTYLPRTRAKKTKSDLKLDFNIDLK